MLYVHRLGKVIRCWPFVDTAVAQGTGLEAEQRNRMSATQRRLEMRNRLWNSRSRYRRWDYYPL